MNEHEARAKVAGMASKAAANGGTANQAAFAEWLLETTGYVVRSERERVAFLAAATLAPRSYQVYQAAKPTSSRYVAPAKARRARKAAASA